jgi:hypothetical protein
MLLLRFYCDHEDLSTMLLRCLYDYGVSTTLFLRLYPDSCWPRSRYAYFEHFQNKRSESVELPITKALPQSYCAYEDSTTFLLRFVTIGHGFGHFLFIIVEAASMYERNPGTEGYLSCRVTKILSRSELGPTLFPAKFESLAYA